MTAQPFFGSGRPRVDPEDRAAHLVFAETIRTGMQQAEIDREMLFVIIGKGVIGRWTIKLIRITQFDALL